jgi:trans-2,3-dihydro-3-hydroxyanthranilate isomerase
MTGIEFYIVDVFTEKRFGGNQLAVFRDGSGLDTKMMQTIANEINYSETTFLLPPEQGGDYRVRIFTPAIELPFAGHPLVGTGFTIVAEKLIQSNGDTTTVKMETGVGEIQVTVSNINQQEKYGYSVMTQPVPKVQSQWTHRARLAKAFDLELSDIKNGIPIEVLYNGIPVMIVPVVSIQSLKRIRVDMRALEDIVKESRAKTILLFTTETSEANSTAHCRVYAPGAGVLEDAATGSANGPLGFYLARHHLIEVKSLTKITSEQGYEMNRPSKLNIELDLDEEKSVTGVRVGGGVAITGRGEIFV